MNPSSEGLSGLAAVSAGFIQSVKDTVAHCDDAHLNAWLSTPGSGPLSVQAVQDIIKAEVARRNRDIVWAVHEGHDYGSPTLKWIVTNTRTGTSSAVSKVRGSVAQDKAFAVETVAGYNVEKCGTFDGVDIFKAV